MSNCRYSEFFETEPGKVFVRYILGYTAEQHPEIFGLIDDVMVGATVSDEGILKAFDTGAAGQTLNVDLMTGLNAYVKKFFTWPQTTTQDASQASSIPDGQQPLDDAGADEPWDATTPNAEPACGNYKDHHCDGHCYKQHAYIRQTLPPAAHIRIGRPYDGELQPDEPEITVTVPLGTTLIASFDGHDISARLSDSAAVDAGLCGSDTDQDGDDDNPFSLDTKKDDAGTAEA